MHLPRRRITCPPPAVWRLEDGGGWAVHLQTVVAPKKEGGALLHVLDITSEPHEVLELRRNILLWGRPK